MMSYLGSYRSLNGRTILTAAVISLLGSLLATTLPSAKADLVSYDVGDFSSTGFSASVIHAATSSDIGTGVNAGKRGGAKSGMLSGSFGGDLTLDVLTGISGAITGDVLAVGFSGTSFELKLGSAAGSGKTGSLVFETSTTTPGEFNGGFIDYALHIDGSSTAASTGTFFFQALDQEVTGSDPLNPNRGTSAAFTLWGNNYMHSGHLFGSTEWLDFLTPLGYLGGFVGRSDVELTDTPLGIDLFSRINLSSTSVPEPSQVLAWSLLSLALCGFGFRSKR